jgi:phosphate/sulfate permease
MLAFLSVVPVSAHAGFRQRADMGKVLCAATRAAGTAAGGWRIIRTLGHRMVKLHPVHGFAAETTAALIIQASDRTRRYLLTRIFARI